MAKDCHPHNPMCIVGKCTILAWEKQTLSQAIHVACTYRVRLRAGNMYCTNPHTVRRVLQKRATRADANTERPACTCHTISASTPGYRLIDGHVALVPITVFYADGGVARPNNPLPLPGWVAKSQAVKAILKICSDPQLPCPNLPDALPRNLWPQSGDMLAYVRERANFVCESLYVKIVDKGVGVMWGFCEWWAWGQLQDFLDPEGYKDCSVTAPAIKSALQSTITKAGWECNLKGRLCSVYLIGKSKSLKKGEWLWRSICAIPAPFFTKKQLRVGARSMTRFLRYMSEEKKIPCIFLVHSVKEVSQWYAALDELGITHISEINCKDQFNKIPRKPVLSHMPEAFDWLSKKRRWRAKQVVWSIQREHEQLDRAGQGASGNFWYISHDELRQVLSFEITDNIHVSTICRLWKRTHCIPMGGSFSAQSADLHGAWGLYKNRQLLRALGDLKFTQAGFPY